MFLKMKKINNKSLIILLGGKGTRFSDLNSSPKQLMILNKHTILMNIINNYKKNGINNFILPLGNKKQHFVKFFSKRIIKKYNLNIVDVKKFELEQNKTNIILFDAGERTSKNKRILKALNYIEFPYFFVTYGDGVANLNIKKSIKEFEKSQKPTLVCSKKINSNYGHLRIKNNLVNKFLEKPILPDPINIGFYIFKKTLFEKLGKKFKSLENDLLPYLSKKNLLKNYDHKGYFFNFDSKNDFKNMQRTSKSFLRYL